MSATHSSAFKIRYSEIDAYGHVNNANYARYMQEAAFEASAAVGFDLNWYAANDYLFVVRASHIEYLQQSVYGDTLEVRTWVSDARRVSSRRQYEIRNSASGAMVCRAHTDWVLIRKSTLRPAALTPAMVEAFAAEHVELDAAKPLTVAQPAPPAGKFVMRRQVRFQHLDSEKVVNNPVYLDYCSDCGFATTAHFGWPVARMIENGFGIFYRTIDIEYLQPAVLDDALDIGAWLSDVKRATGMRHFSITRARDGVEVARTNALCVCADLTKGAPMRWPEAVRSDLAANISEAVSGER